MAEFLTFQKEPQVGDKLLVFVIEYDGVMQNKTRHFKVRGEIFRDLEAIGTVEYKTIDSPRNAVMEFFERTAAAYPPFQHNADVAEGRSLCASYFTVLSWLEITVCHV